MKSMRLLLIAGIALTVSHITYAQVAGSTTVGVAAAELRDVSAGWSVKRTILGQAVYNDKDERVGAIDDIIVSPDYAVSFAIVMREAS